VVKKIWQILWFCGVACAAGAAVAQEEIPAAGVAIPELDVAGSVRRMLEASRTEPGEAAAQPAAAGVPGENAPAPAAVPVAPPPAAATPPVAPGAAPSPLRPGPSAAPPARLSDHVPLPEREFTIRSTDDIRELARELEEAKRRQQR
jgi:hypothetical protein